MTAGGRGIRALPQEVGTVRTLPPRAPRRGRPGVSVLLDELDEQGVTVELTAPEAQALQATGLVEVRPEAPPSYRLLPCGTVGAVRVGDTQVRVRPKDGVSLAALLFLLGYASDPGFLPSDVDGFADDDLWPAFAASLAQAAERALMAGVLRGYVSEDASLRTVRGRIRFSDQVSRHPGSLLPLEVTYDEYTEDIPENQVLRTAVQRMLTVPRLNEDVRRRLAHLDARLGGATPVPHGARLPQWTPARQNVRYQPALRLARVVLERASAESQAGGALQVAAFVVAMPQVFGEFLGVALEEALPPSAGRAVTGARSTLDEPRRGADRGDLPLDVDLLLQEAGGRSLGVVDSRYRTLGRGQRALPDHYTLLGACHAFGAHRAWLVPARAGDPEPVARTVMGGEVVITTWPVDLSQPPKEILAQTGALARDIARSVTRASRTDHDR